MSLVSPSSSQAVGSASSLTLYTPAQTTPDATITLTGAYTGNPQALDYNFGSGWVDASSVSFNDGLFTITIPGGLPAGSYTPEVRDHTATAVASSGGDFVVSAWTPETLTTSPGAKAVFEFNVNNPDSTILGSNGAVDSVINSVDPSESLTAVTATDGNPIVIAEQSGADGDRRVLEFHSSKQGPDNYDPSTDWLSAGGVNGPGGSALVDLANSPNLGTTGSFTTIISLKIDKSFSYEAGPLWGSLATSSNGLQYAQLRYNNGSGLAGAQITDSNLVGVGAQSTITAGWHVLTLIKNDGELSYRLDGKPIQTSVIRSHDQFTAADFMIGGGLPPNSSSSDGMENGVPPPDVGEFQAYSGVLAGSDLEQAEALAGNAVGLNIDPDAPCFAAGTRILTLRGAVAVEDLRAGDLAVTRRGGVNVAEPVIWIGQRLVEIAHHPRPERVRPIRFAPDALGAGRPASPLLLSPDHALMLDGMLIAARQLVNGGSITVLDLPAVRYFHVELARHSILLAENVEAESYLDTGNRASFSNAGASVALHPDFSRENSPLAAAPLTTEESRVQPVWQRLAQRATELGYATPQPVAARRTELALQLADGTRLRPARIMRDGRHVFLLPEETAPELLLVSDHAAPADLDPCKDDRRQLGVAVGGIAVRTRRTGPAMRHVLVDGPALSSGWWGPETDGERTWRWTDGNARLVVPAGCMRIDITVVAMMQTVPTPARRAA